MQQTALLKEKRMWGGISSFTLHIIAMAAMLFDHMWATVIPGQQWMTQFGRIAFPIFAFMIAEGYHYTKDFKKYALRMLIFALISEVPYNLMTESTAFNPFGQNVMWTFLIALLCMRGADKIKDKFKLVPAVILTGLLVFACYIFGKFTFVDYYGEGVLMVLVFHFFRGDRRYYKIVQAVGIIYINMFMLKGLVYPVEFFGYEFELQHQALAVLSLPIIFLYKGRQGLHNKVTKFIFYAFYPAHMLILALLAMYVV